MKRITFYLAILFVLASMQSCITPKDTTFLLPNENLKLNEFGYIGKTKTPYRFIQDDAVSILIESPNVAIFEGYFPKDLIPGPIVGEQLFLRDMYINEDGYLNIPVMGKVYLHGLTFEEASKAVKRKILEFKGGLFNENSFDVYVKTPGINFTVISPGGGGGQVGGGGGGGRDIVIYQSEVSIIEALAMQLSSPTIDKKKIRLYRQTPEGTKLQVIDITREDIQNSEYFWVQPNDIFYLDSLPEKYFGIGENVIGTVNTLTTAILTPVLLYFTVDNLLNN